MIGKVDKVSQHPANADKFLAFMKSRTVQDIYAKYGFVPHFK